MSTMVSIKMVSRTVMVYTNGNQDLYILENFLMEWSMVKVNGKKMKKIKNQI